MGGLNAVVAASFIMAAIVSAPFWVPLGIVVYSVLKVLLGL